MVRIDLPGIHRMRKRLASGAAVEYHYAHRGGPLIWKTGHPYEIGSAPYIEAYRAAQMPTHAAGMFREIIIEFQESAEWRKLSARTKADYQRWIDRIDAKFGTAPKAAFERPEIRRVALKWRDQWSGRQADYGWTVLVRIVSWAKRRTILTHNHLEGEDRLYKASRAEIIWTPAEVATMAAAPAPIALAVEVARETGLRPQSLVILSRAHVQPTPLGRRIFMRTQKTGATVSIPVTPRMGEILDALPAGQMLVLKPPRAARWDKTHLSKEVKKAARKLGLRDELHLYDLRGTACTRLLMAGATLAEIATIFGWSIATAAKMIQTYAALDPSASDGVLVKLAKAKSGTSAVERPVE